MQVEFTIPLGFNDVINDSIIEIGEKGLSGGCFEGWFPVGVSSLSASEGFITVAWLNRD